MNTLIRLILPLAILTATPAFPAGGKLALVIGNESYPEQPLKNPANDASDMGAALKRLGFDVMLFKNTDLQQMEEAVRGFGDRLKGSQIALFFYAGHGVQADGANYLIPVKADLRSANDLRYKAMDVNYVMDFMEDAGSKLNIVILDACRNNPFRGLRGGNRGLLNMSGPTGSIIAFATSPNNTAEDGLGRNGVYTQHLLKHIETPGLSIEDMFKQVRIDVTRETQGRQTPWENSSLASEFCFATCTAPVDQAAVESAKEVARVKEQNDKLAQELDRMRAEQRESAARLEELRALQKDKERLEAQIANGDRERKAQEDYQKQLAAIAQEKSALEKALREKETASSASSSEAAEQLAKLASEKARLESELKKSAEIAKSSDTQLEELNRIRKEKERLEKEAKQYADMAQSRTTRIEQLEQLKTENERLLSSLRERDDRLRASESELRAARKSAPRVSVAPAENSDSSLIISP